MEEVLGFRPSRSTVYALLKAYGLSWKKCKKVLGKANPEKRQAYIERFQHLFEQVCQDKAVLLYMDEVHLHRDLDLGYTWSPKGKPAYRLSACAPLSDRINWYGVYNFTDGACLIWNEGNCNKEHTVLFLERIDDWLGEDDRTVFIVLDGAPWHVAHLVRDKAEEFGFQLIFLPGYSPDLNPIEGLWKWMREEVTQHHAYKNMRQLFDACKDFIHRINRAPEAMTQRLWPKLELDPGFEKLLVSL